MLYLNKEREITYKNLEVVVKTQDKDTWETTTHTIDQVWVNTTSDKEILDTVKLAFSKGTKIKIMSFEVVNEIKVTFSTKSVIDNYQI